MDKLRNCPFCGGEADKKITQTPFPHGWVGCPKCKCYMQWQHDPRGAVEKWNRRATDGN